MATTADTKTRAPSAHQGWRAMTAMKSISGVVASTAQRRKAQAASSAISPIAPEQRRSLPASLNLSEWRSIQICPARQ